MQTRKLEKQQPRKTENRSKISQIRTELERTKNSKPNQADLIPSHDKKELESVINRTEQQQANQEQISINEFTRSGEKTVTQELQSSDTKSKTQKSN
ncbi:hypothetical protein L1887_10888 [Cichorium endivia]|nr:hypothetical protein L1887_10888 [Cichorium endivia]